MRFLADMGVDVRIVGWLRQQAHNAIHLRDEGLQRSTDSEIFAKAVADDRVVLTFDLDFGEIAAFTKGRKASVILFRLHNTRTPHVIDRLARALCRTAPPPWKKAPSWSSKSHGSVFDSFRLEKAESRGRCRFCSRFPSQSTA